MQGINALRKHIRLPSALPRPLHGSALYLSPVRHRPDRRIPLPLLRDVFWRYPGNALSGFPFFLSVLKSVRLPAAAMQQADVPARFPDCHIHMQVFHNH